MESGIWSCGFVSTGLGLSLILWSFGSVMVYKASIFLLLLLGLVVLFTMQSSWGWTGLDLCKYPSHARPRSW